MMRPLIRMLMAMVIGAVTLGVAGPSSVGSPAQAEGPLDPCQLPGFWHVSCDERGRGGGDEDGEGGDEGGEGGAEEEPCYGFWHDCGWFETFCTDWQVGPGDSSLAAEFPDAPDGAIMLNQYCDPVRGPDNFPWEEGPFYRYGYVDPVETPELMADDVWVELQQGLESPVLAASPPQGTRFFVEVPTFVAVSNWRGEIDEENCLASPLDFVCIEFTATPTLLFDPGDGSGAEECRAPGSWEQQTESGTTFGTTYAEGDGRSRDIADVDGACAHIYQDRSVGSPWQADVTVRWEASWEAPYFGTSGTFPDYEQVSTLPRAVGEVQSVVTEAELG